MWEKDETDDSDDGPDEAQGKPVQPADTPENELQRSTSAGEPLSGDEIVPGTSGIVVETIPAVDSVTSPPHRRSGKQRRKSKRYYSKDECAICMENFSRGEVVRILPCGHVFHKDECDEWLLKWRKLVSLRATNDVSAPADMSSVSYVPCRRHCVSGRHLGFDDSDTGGRRAGRAHRLRCDWNGGQRGRSGGGRLSARLAR